MSVGVGLLERLFAPAGSTLPLPRLLVVLAHPDDEVLALGARLERMGDSRLVCVTDGAPEDLADARAHGFGSRGAYAEERRRELERALGLAGVAPGCARGLRLKGGLAVADQAGVSHLAAMAWAVAREIEAFGPEAVLTHPYEGGHPDHDSCAFAVHGSVGLVGEGRRPVVVEAPFYHSRGVRTAGATGIETGCFLPGQVAGEVEFELSAGERERKKERLACFATQRETLGQFAVDREVFRLAPAYDFTVPPHPGRLLYEEFSWGTDGAGFREHASVALGALRAGKTRADALAER